MKVKYEDERVAYSIEGRTPNCCIIPSVFELPQDSTIF